MREYRGHPRAARAHDRSMRVGVALPAQVAGVQAQDVFEYAVRAERNGFDAVWVLDRLVYNSFAPVPLLAATAALTQRVTIGTCILLANLYSPLLLAKELATIDRLSHGRLLLGVAAGGRDEDFHAAGVDTRKRGQRLEETVSLLRATWSGEAIHHGGEIFTFDSAAIGPRPCQSPPPIWMGGRSDLALRRAVRIGDGYIIGRSGPAALQREIGRVTHAAQTIGRNPATFKTAALAFYNLSDAVDGGLNAVETYLRAYYGLPETLTPSRDTVYGPLAQAADRIGEFVATGVDELILTPTSPDPTQLDRLSEAAVLARRGVSPGTA
jgi:probable F420-dependent oxidoreductase